MVAGDRLADRIGIGVLAKVFTPELVDRVVEQAGVREQRTRTLPARVVVYYLLAMVLFFQSGYGEVWNKLVAGLDWARRFRARLDLGMQPSPAAITLCAAAAGLAGDGGPDGGGGRAAGRGGAGARVRGGDAAGGRGRDVPGPAGHAGERGGVRLPGQRRRAGPVPADPRGRPRGMRDPGGARRGTSRLATGEQPLTRQLLGKLAPGTCCWPTGTSCPTACSQTCSPPGCTCCGARKATWICRCWRCCRTAPGCRGSPTRPPPAGCAARAASGRDIPGITVRVIEYSVTSEDGSEISETFTLVTDLLDPALLTPQQAAAAYASRWQLETCFDELETSIRGGAAVVLRSKSPPMIRQEIYAMLCCYQAIRTLISHAADDAGIDPARISFTRARDGIRSRISDSGCFSP